MTIGILSSAGGNAWKRFCARRCGASSTRRKWIGAVFVSMLALSLRLEGAGSAGGMLIISQVNFQIPEELPVKWR